MKVAWEKEINASKVIVSPRPVWKCRVCPMYGRALSCPPYAPDWREAKEWVHSFKRALLIKFEINYNDFENEKRQVLHYLLRREESLFKSGYMYALALFPGNCNLCDECPVKDGKSCIMPTKVRPSVDAIGIEISKNVDIDFNESALYGMIFID